MMGRKLSRMAVALGANFTLNGKPITIPEVFSDNGLLPAIARRADQLCALILGYGIGISFDEEKDSTLGVKVIFDDITPDVLRYVCVLDVLNELIKAGPSKDVTPLDELLYD